MVGQLNSILVVLYNYMCMHVAWIKKELWNK